MIFFCRGGGGVEAGDLCVSLRWLGGLRVVHFHAQGKMEESDCEIICGAPTTPHS